MEVVNAAVEVETKGEEDWLVEKARIKKEKKSAKPTVNSPEFTVKVEEIEDLTTLFVGIDLKTIF